MNKIMIIGCPGSGKSTLAKQLSKKLNLPLYHLDLIWHKPDKTNVSKEEFDEQLRMILSQKEWIVDGNYQRTLKMRMDACDTVILLDLPLEVCLEGAQTRIGKERNDMPWKEESFDPEFKKWIEDFAKTQLPEIYQLLEQADHQQVIIFKSRQEISEWLIE